VYVDDVVRAIETLLANQGGGFREESVGPVYETTVGEVADTIRMFAAGRQTRAYGAVGAGLTRALYATYVSYLPVEDFSYNLHVHRDPRGSFAELLRTPDAGQFSFFTANPGATRGGHYHHSKTEKFLVVQGKARFRFRHVLTGQKRELLVDGVEARVVETVPGWAHDITNVGEDQLIAMLWANEVFDPKRPDTISAAV
jgi:UDP-2-acetamido-2,6-beta-L-arabino-hexul-4-ose reductase